MDSNPIREEPENDQVMPDHDENPVVLPISKKKIQKRKSSISMKYDQKSVKNSIMKRRAKNRVGRISRRRNRK